MKLLKTEEEKQQGKFQKLLEVTRKAIPERYNHIELMDDLLDPEIDWYVSISNRSDGKTFNYINMFTRIALEFNVKFMLLARHYTVQNAYVSFMIELFTTLPDLDEKQLSIRRNDDYVVIAYGKQELCVITDMNNATDLRYYSNYLKQFPLLVYDEFLSLESDYLPDEWEKIKTIYESIDRNHGNIPLIRHPKVFLLGNAVNFSSPLLANLDLFNRLENHPINTKQRYGNIIMELRRNDHVNELRNTRAFKSDDDAMTTAQFSFNNTYIATEVQRVAVKQNARICYVKLEKMLLKIMYNDETLDTILSVVVNSVEEYEYCTEITDYKPSVLFLKETWYRDNHPQKYVKGRYLFDNSFSKEFITSDNQLARLNVHRVIKHHRMKNRGKPIDKEAIFYDNYMERTMRAIARKFEGM